MRYYSKHSAKKRHALLPLFSCLFVTPSIQPLYAEDVETKTVKNSVEKSTQLETIKVEAQAESATKQHLEESFFETYTRDLITSETLEEEMTPDVKTALRDVTNIAVTDNGAFTKNIEIRGLSGDRISYSVDDVSIANQGLTHSGGGEVNLIDISTVKSIDVIKGSPSVIYAPGATAGVIIIATKRIADKEGFSGEVSATYDTGYELDSKSIKLQGRKQKLGASITVGRTNANAYNVRNQDKLDELILRTNVLDERLGTSDEIKDLGFSSETLNLQGEYRINKQQHLNVQHSNFEGNDISFTHGGSTSRVFHYDAFNREANKLAYHFKGDNGNQLNISLYNQEIVKDIRDGATINRTLLDSTGLVLKAKRHLDVSILQWGAEIIRDAAETNTFSDQDYYAAYANYETTPTDKLTLSAGARANHWKVEQHLKAGQNSAVLEGLAGVSGRIAAQDEDALTYASGLIFSPNEQHNLSFNYSHTHRYPTLMERFAFDVFVGGGLGLKAESADNIELGWKYNKGSWYTSAALFYSRFDDYLGAKEVRTLNDVDALNECIRLGDCDLATGDFDHREEDFFDIKVNYANFEKATNKGFELAVKKVLDNDMEAGFSMGLNELGSDSVFVSTDSHPLTLKGYYKKHFPALPSKPWVKLKARYVTDSPHVKQKEGFNAFLAADLYLGGELGRKSKKLSWNAGVRNLFDKVYHEPYSALDGLERSFTVGVKYKF